MLLLCKLLKNKKQFSKYYGHNLDYSLFLPTNSLILFSHPYFVVSHLTFFHIISALKSSFTMHLCFLNLHKKKLFLNFCQKKRKYFIFYFIQVFISENTFISDKKSS